jgi:hypothetical protein
MPSLPQVRFCDTQISRLLIGDNPLYGYAHFNRLLSAHQTEYHTSEQVLATLARAEEVGITGWQITFDELRDILKRIRDTGKNVGLSVNTPDLLKTAEDEGWDVDYYMAGLYHLQGAAREFEEKFGHKPLGEVYLREHRDTMCDVVRQASKPCIAFKALAAGRAIGSSEQIKAELRYALERIKPTDSLLVGMYQKFGDQVGENAAIVGEICADLDAV